MRVCLMFCTGVYSERAFVTCLTALQFFVIASASAVAFYLCCVNPDIISVFDEAIRAALSKPKKKKEKKCNIL